MLKKWGILQTNCWCQENELYVALFYRKEMLYSNDQKLIGFINPAPFSKFYLKLIMNHRVRVLDWVANGTLFVQNNDMPLEKPENQC
jgi:hypothetical protein